MSSLPLDLHEALEEEYISMYGPFERLSSGPKYTDSDLIDERSARAILADCAIEPRGSVIEALNALVVEGDVEKLCGSRVLTDAGRAMITGYSEYIQGVGEERCREINRRIIDVAFTGAVRSLRDVRLAHLYAKLHARDNKEARTALCISGGGTRSATFALGILQGLAGARILDKFDFLSTVSSGGYIGGWLSAWARRHPDGISGVQEDLVRGDSTVPGRQVDNLPPSKTHPEALPVRHLREYSRHFRLKQGLTSGDYSTMASLYMRNLTLNLLVLVPLLAAVLAIPRLFALLLRHDPTYHQSLLLMIMVGALAVGFGYLGLTRATVRGGYNVKFLGRISANAGFVVCVVALVVAAEAMSLYWAQAASESWSTICKDWPWALGAIAATTLLPNMLYYGRYLGTTAFERHERLRRHSLWKKLYVEFMGAALGVAITALLFYFLADMVFDKPVSDLPDPMLPPFLRALLASVPMTELYVCLSVPLVLVVFFVQTTAFVGVSSKFNDDYDREWWARAGAWLLMTAAFLAAGSFISVFGPVFLYRAPVFVSSLGGISGIIAALVGFSTKTSPKGKEKDGNGKATALGNALLALAVPLFVVVLLASISLGTTVVIRGIRGEKVPESMRWLEQFQSTVTYSQATTVDGARIEAKLETDKMPYLSVITVNGFEHLETIRATDWTILGFIALVAIYAFLLSLSIGVNGFLLDALQRNLINRAYLGASRYPRERDTFTGVDPRDNLQMFELYGHLIWSTSFTDANQFVKQLNANFTKARSVEQIIWNALDKQTRIWIEENHPVDAALTNSLVENLNRILVQEAFDGQIGDSSAARIRSNRAILTAAFPSIRPPQSAPLHVVSLASREDVTKQREDVSFSVSPLHCGSFVDGYRDSREYGGIDGIALGTAVTISAAQARPTPSYYLSPASFLWALLDIRLGSWLSRRLLELTRNSSGPSSLVHLADGSQFENLGVYEMILRRCRFIVVTDGSRDPRFTFEDLGNAIRKIRTDLGVPIDMRNMFMFPRTPDGVFPAGSYVATASIRYSAIDENAPDGTLIYLKPALYSESYLPKDIYSYASESLDFPHESTADQFFSAAQFESYRALGRHVINEICGNYAAAAPYANTFVSVAAFADAVEAHAAKIAQSKP
jgi:Patatin-like phospholipase